VDVTKTIAVAGGDFHTIELKSDGTVWSWGSNKYGQLGDGTMIDSPAPIQVSSLTNVTDIAAGGEHSISLKNDGTVWTWGYNRYGQLGNGTTIDSPVPIQVNGLTDVTDIATGEDHSIALKNDGTVWTWGYNRYGQLGVETTEECEFGLMNWYCSTTPIQVSGLTDVTAIAAGVFHSIALKSDGTVWTWGGNYWGQLGDGTTTGSTTPVQISELTDVTDIAAGGRHTVAVKSDGTVWTWGSNEHGQLGDGTTTYNTTTPVQVSGLTDVTDIAAGGRHTIAVKSDGTVWTWGSNEHGQLGVTTTEICEVYSTGRYLSTYSTFCSTTPVQVSDLTDITAITAGWFHSIAIRTYNTVWTWGGNKYGQLGAITTETCGYEDAFNCSPTPVQVSSKVAGTFSVGGTLNDLTGTLVLQNNGGDDLTITENGPFTFVTELEDLAIYKIEILTQPDGQVCEIVSINSGRINSTDITDLQIICFTKVVDIAAGHAHTVALKLDGTIWAWGDGLDGQLGDGAWSNSFVPVKAFNLVGIIDIAGGQYFYLALKNDGTIWGWGNNYSGQLGDETKTSYSNTTVQVVNP